MRSFRHWTPRYIFNRLMDILYQKRHPDHPMLTPRSISILEHWIKSSDIGFEWGSGRSTVWFAEKVKQLISVEHDMEWYQKISNNLKDKNINNVNLHKCSLEGENNSNYVKAISNFSDKSFDLVLVDGRLRGWCLLEALPKIKNGGLIVLDDAHLYMPNNSRSPGSIRDLKKSEWNDVYQSLAGYRHVWTSNGIKDTVIYFKS